MEHLSTSLLSGDDIVSIRGILDQSKCPWVDGRLTAGELAAKVKRNFQLNPTCEEARKTVDLVTTRIRENPLIKSYSLIKKVHSVLVSRCDESNGYGWHVDNPFTKHGRRDISFTVFLSDKNEYSGGELEMQGSLDSTSIKLDSGQIVLYPSSTMHCVNTVSKGSRIVCVGWIESYVKAIEDRLLLFTLESAARSLLAKYGRSDEIDLVYQSYANAVRRLSS